MAARVPPEGEAHATGRLIEGSVRVLCLFAAATLAILMMAVTVVDVVLRWFGAAIPGAFELVTLGMRFMVPLSFPYVLWIGGHVAVDFLVGLGSARLQRVAVRASALVTSIVMAGLAFAVTQRALTVARYGEVTADLGLPQFYYWIPLIVGTALCVPVGIYIALRGPSHSQAALAHRQID